MSLSFAIPDSVLSTSLANYRNTLQENIFKANPLFFWLVGQHSPFSTAPGDNDEARGQLIKLSGGESIVVPLLYEKNSTAQSYSGYGLLNTTPQEGMTSAKYNWKQYAVSVSISGKEMRQNAGSTRVINLMESKMKQAEMSLQEYMDVDAFSANTDSSTGMLGLQTLVATTGTAGGIARSGNSWWQAKVATSVGSFAAGGLDAMRTKYNDVSKGNDHADVIITDQTSFERYEKTLQPQERFQDNKVADGGFENLKFKGAVMMFDVYCTAGYMYFLNSKYLNLVVHNDANFANTDFVKPENQDAKVAQIIWMGELTVSNCSRQGVLQGLTA